MDTSSSENVTVSADDVALKPPTGWRAAVGTVAAVVRYLASSYLLVIFLYLVAFLAPLAAADMVNAAQNLANRVGLGFAYTVNDVKFVLITVATILVVESVTDWRDHTYSRDLENAPLQTKAVRDAAILVIVVRYAAAAACLVVAMLYFDDLARYFGVQAIFVHHTAVVIAALFLLETVGGWRHLLQLRLRQERTRTQIFWQQEIRIDRADIDRALAAAGVNGTGVDGVRELARRATKTEQ